MNQEPIALYIFRFIFGFGLFAFMGMLYWSSVLVEEDLKLIQEDLKQIKNEVLATRRGVEKIQGNTPQGQGLNYASSIQAQPQPIPAQNLFASVSENLLTPDPFYTHTLPNLLGPHFKPHGIRKEDTVGKPDNLHPFNNWSQAVSWNALCTVALTKEAVGKFETFTPEMAVSMELRYTLDGHPEYWLFLRKDLFWQPLDPLHFPENVELAPRFLHKHQVTAHDFKFYYDALMNPNVEEAQAVALRLYYNDIEEFRVVDDFTLVVRWKTIPIKGADGKETYQMKYLAKTLTGSLRPLARFVYQYFADGTKIITNDADPDTYRTNPIWALNFAQHWANNVIVSCGPWLFDGMTDREIRFRRNPDYFDPYAVLVEAYEIQFRDSPDAIWEDFKSGFLDLVDIPPHLIVEFDDFLQSKPYQHQLQKGLGIKRLDYLARSYNYIGWNQARPFFTSRKVRQALTLAIDRERIIRENLNGMGMQTTGPFFLLSPSYDASLKPYPFDPIQARQLLLEEGWYDSNGDGVIDKLINGKRVSFSFTLTYFFKNPTTKSICEYIATALKEIGIECHPNGVDMADLSAVFDDKDFDAVFLGWALGSPPEDPKQLWYSSGAKERGSSNAIGFANAEADRIIDQLTYEIDPKKRIELYHQFDAIIYEEAPYTFLYTPKIALAYRDYLQNVFIPAERQDLIPGANVGEPLPNLFFLRRK
jgi:peptide/nickel transport system substrate-binding protein